MSQKQTKRAEEGIESLLCTFEDCKELQDEENEFCFKHSHEPITTQEEARQYAIDWQNWSSRKNLYMSELGEWHTIFTNLGEEYNLTEEFKENGII